MDYVVVHHAEPDHSDCIREVVDASGAVLLGHPLAKSMLESFHDSRFKYQPVRDGSTLEIEGLKLRFIHLPWLHWSETMPALPRTKVFCSRETRLEVSQFPQHCLTIAKMLSIVSCSLAVNTL